MRLEKTCQHCGVIYYVIASRAASTTCGMACRSALRGIRDRKAVWSDEQVRAKFDSLYQIDAVTGCWLWQGTCVPDGYGMFTAGHKADRSRRAYTAHRYAYELHIGLCPDGAVLDHLCRNRNCVNPAHLEPVSTRENLIRGERNNQHKGKTHCKHGHEFTPENTGRDNRGNRYCKNCHADSRKREVSTFPRVSKKQQWQELCAEHGNRCLCCGEVKPLTRDHIIPKSLGGSDAIANLQPLCFPCNRKKQQKTVDFASGQKLPEVKVKSQIASRTGEIIPAPQPRPRRGQSDKTHCKYGHEFMPENTGIETYKERVFRRCLACYEQQKLNQKAAYWKKKGN